MHPPWFATWCVRVCVCNLVRVCAHVYILVVPCDTPCCNQNTTEVAITTQSCNWLYVYIAPGCIIYIECTQTGEQTGHAHTHGRAHHTSHHPRTHLVRPTPHTPGRAAHTRSCPLWHTPYCNQNTTEVATITHRVAIGAFSTENMLHPPWLQLVLAQLQLA
jgi:hypothetical protein